MMMPIHPGRGGRGINVYRKPKYLSTKPPKLTFGNRYDPRKNKYGILQEQFEISKDYDLFPIQEQNEISDDIESQGSHLKLSEIPDSTIKSFQMEDSCVAPENKKSPDVRTNEFTMIVRRNKKKSKNKVSLL